MVEDARTCITNRVKPSKMSMLQQKVIDLVEKIGSVERGSEDHRLGDAQDLEAVLQHMLGGGRRQTEDGNSRELRAQDAQLAVIYKGYVIDH